jgi:hypothetical protein
MGLEEVLPLLQTCRTVYVDIHLALCNGLPNRCKKELVLTKLQLFQDD